MSDEKTQAANAAKARAAAPPAIPVRMNFEVYKTARGFEGPIAIPLSNGKTVKAHAPGKTRGQALGKAAALAKKIEENPVLAALLPPQASLALKATTALAKADAVGKFADVASKITGPAMSRLKSLFGG
jgi:hypothetical protein